MIGSILIFLFVCGLVAAFMWIAHSFVRASENPEDGARENPPQPVTMPSGNLRQTYLLD